MSRPQQPQHTLTDAEWGTLADLINRQDDQGIKAFFSAMPPEKARAILTQLVVGAAIIGIAGPIVDYLRHSS